MSAPVVASSSSTAESHRTNSTASPPSNAATGTSSPRVASPTFPPISFRARPGSASASRTTASLPTTTTTTATATATTATTTTTAEASTTSSSSAAMALSPTLPSASSQLHIAEARAALVASVSNMLDSELQSRAGLLHANAAALGRQERDVERATEALRRENDKLAGVARDAGRKIKELGNVQNWAEVLERDFLVLEETVRIVRDGDGEADDDDDCSVCSGSCFCSWSGSEGARSRSRSRSRGGSRSRSRSRGGSVVRARQVEANGNDKKEELNGAVRNDATKDGTANGGVGTAPAVSVSNVKVLADDALIQSLTEAMATEMHVVVGPPRADEPPPPPPSAAPDKDKDKDKGKGPLCQNDQLEKRDLDGSHDDAPPESTAPSTSSSAAGEEGDRQRQ